MADYDLYERDAPALSGLERGLFEATSIDEPWALVERFTELERVDGSADQRAAAEYIVERLDALDISHETHEPEIRSTLPESASVSIDVGGSVEDVGTHGAVKPELFTRSGSVRAAAVAVERDAHDGPRSGFADPDVDLDDKIAVVRAHPLSINAKVDLAAAGACGIVTVHPLDPEPCYGRVSSTGWGGVREPGDPPDDDVVAVAVAESVGERILGAIESGTRVALELTASVDTDWRACPLVVATITGGAAPATDEFVLLHAHYDSWWAGITDNATGDAGILECARVLSNHADALRRDLRLAWWPGHSQASYAGSAWYAAEFADELDANCVAHVNMDGTGGEEATEFTDGPAWMPAGDRVCSAAVRDVCGKEADRNRPHRAGDYSFTNLGVTGLFLNASNVPREIRGRRGWDFAKDPRRYHLPSDTIERADPDVLLRDVRVYVILLARLLRRPVLPLDLRDTVASHRETIDAYDRRAGDRFSLAAVGDALADLDAAVAAFYRAVEADRVDPETANETIVGLSRLLVPLDFAVRGRFAQDSTLLRPPYPRLAPVGTLDELGPDGTRQERTRLARARNEVVDSLEAAASLARSAAD